MALTSALVLITLAFTHGLAFVLVGVTKHVRIHWHTFLVTFVADRRRAFQLSWTTTKFGGCLLGENVFLPAHPHIQGTILTRMRRCAP